MISLKALLITSAVCLVVGIAGGIFFVYQFQRDRISRTDQIVTSNTIRVIDNMSTKLKTVYSPAATDTVKYTNLHDDCSELVNEVIDLTNKIFMLAAQDSRLRLLAGISYINRPGIPIAATAGIEWATFAVLGSVGVSSNFSVDLASVNLLWRF